MSKEATTSGSRQFLVLLYKGLLLRKRHYIMTFLEIVIPILIASIPAIIKSEVGIRNNSFDRRGDFVERSKWTNATFYNPFNPLYKYASSDSIEFVYSPANKRTEKFMTKAIDFWERNNKPSNIQNHSLNSEDEMEKYCLNKRWTNPSLIMIGTVFNNFNSEESDLPSSLDYKIRYGGYYGGDIFANKLKYRMNGPQSSNAYMDSFFLSWQATIEQLFIEEKMVEVGKNFSYELQMQRFPYPRHKSNSSQFSELSIIPWVVCYGFLFFITNLIRRVIEEKSNGSKELLKMMGMTDCLYWTSTFINYFLVAALVTLIITIIYKVPLKQSIVMVQNTDFILLFILLLLFVIHLVLFCFAVTTIFNRAIFAIIVVMISYSVSLSVLSTSYFMMNTDVLYFPLSRIAKLSICLLPTGGLLTMLFIVSVYESSGEGAHWYNITDYSASPDINLLMIMGMVAFSCLLYCLIIWYVDAVWPWQYGVPKPFYFPFTKSYWCGYEGKNGDEDLISKENENDSEFFEDEPTGISPGVIIHKMSKVFRTGLQTKVAVNNISLNIYSGQITALLGHNGAGKTTTINILTGLYTPTSGTASINGYNILTQTKKARRSLGVCPQHNVLYDTLTVEEHLKIYAGLKGVPWNRLSQEATAILKMLHLTDKRNELTKNISGGMKRKLSLGIAVIGGSKVLFLDEPTSGMDVEARRSVWDTLLDLRRNSTIILTTHYMEEADVLGDRVAIMAEGEIQCCGSPMFLKRKFGTGYHLHIVKDQAFDLQNVTEFIQRYIPEAFLQNEVEKEASFNLSSNSSSSFGALFEDLENNKIKLGLQSSGLTVTTMEDVFLNVANISDLKFRNKLADIVDSKNHLMFEDAYSDAKQFQRFPSALDRMLGLLLKRINYAKRHWSILLTQLALPFILMCVCQYTISSTSNKFSMTYPSLQLNIKDVYGSTNGFYQTSNDPGMKIFVEKMKKVLHENDISLKETSGPLDFILNYGEKDFAGYLKTLLFGSSSEKLMNDTFLLKAWYNGEPYHVLPMSLLLMNTAILRQVTDSGSIKLENAPLPYASRYFYEDTVRIKERIMANVFIPLALAFLSASFVLVPTLERTSKAKLLQLMTGVPTIMYWFTMFVWDFFIHIIVCIFLIIPFAIFSHYAFFSPHSEAIGTAFLMMMLYGWSAIPFSYLISFVFKKPNTGFSIIICICTICGIAVTTILTTAVVASQAYAKMSQREISIPGVDAFIWFMRLIPSFGVSFGFANLYAIAYNNAFCDSFSPKDLEFSCNSGFLMPENPMYKCCKDICGNNCFNKTYPLTWDRDGTGRDIFFLFIDGVFYFLLVLFFEMNIFRSCIRHIKLHLPKLRKTAIGNIMHDSYSEDPDVLQEEERIRSVSPNAAHDVALKVADLTKIYKNFYAVDHLTFGVNKKECFGLLGVNGAGKTTTFRMLTGDCNPTEGNAYIESYSLIADLKRFQSNIGYCPQFDALIDRLTGREIITLFARLRGLSGQSMTHSVNKLIRMTDLTDYADKQSRFYSGGNKRKLSIAMALIGSPPLILLDEPTAGVDPVSRRKIWNILSQARTQTGAAVILTTHSMEESEALCSRLAIMVNGRFRCLGSLQKLKSKFGQGYTLIVKMKKGSQNDPQTVSTIKNFVSSNLPSAVLKDDHQGMLQYHVTDPSVTLSFLFKFMDNMKPQYDLEDYLISDTSLEQIFLTFARAQRT